MNKLVDIIKKSSEEYTKNRKEYMVHGINIFIKDSLPEKIDIKSVIKQIELLVPLAMFNNIDIIYIGQFDEFIERNVNAFYSDGALYITNDQDNNRDIIDDIIHELSHSLEEANGDIIYASGELEDEFLIKRNILRRILISREYDISGYDLLDPSYSIEFDEFLYKDIGYEKLATLTRGIFISPYATTSLREYWANGFEEYFLGDKKQLFSVSPKLFNIIKDLITQGDY